MPHALVVDDDIDSAASLRALIAGENFTVAVVSDTQLLWTIPRSKRKIALALWRACGAIAVPST